MGKTASTFNSTFQTLLADLELLEKHTKKHNQHLRKAAFSLELAKALHHEQTGVNDHMRRLKLIKIELPKDLKATKVMREMKLTSAKHGRGKNATKDLMIILDAQQLLQLKNVHYHLLHRLAINLALEHAPELIKQTIADNEATHIWLSRIAQRLIDGEELVLEVPA